MSLFPEKQSLFLRTQKDLFREVMEYSNAYRDEREERFYDCTLNRGQQQLMLQCLRKIFWAKVGQLQEHEDEHYKECAQLMKLGLYEPKRSSRAISTTHCRNSFGSSVSESHDYELTPGASEALYLTERESEQTLEEYGEQDVEGSVGGDEAEEDSEHDSGMETEWHTAIDEGSEELSEYEEDTYEGSDWDEPSEDKTDTHESSDELSEYEADTYEGSDEPSECESDEDCGSDEGDVDVDEGYEPSGVTRNEAGGMLAETNEGSDEPSPTSPGLPGRSPGTQSCAEQLRKDTMWRSSIGL
jgi:hypothetical protein